MIAIGIYRRATVRARGPFAQGRLRYREVVAGMMKGSSNGFVWPPECGSVGSTCSGSARRGWQSRS